MRWHARVLRGRLREQAAVVGMVAAVAVAATTLVGVLAGVLHLAETQGAPAALSRIDPDALRIEATLWVRGEDTTVVLGKGRAALAEVTGDVPTTEGVWQEGSLRALPPTGVLNQTPHLTYLSALPPTEDLTRLVEGRWPHGARDASGATEVAVPTVAARDRGWTVGTRIETRPWDGEEYDTWVVVGTYEAAGPRSGWARDRLGGRGTVGIAWPGSAGMRSTIAWGPLVVDPSALAGPELVDTTYLTVHPQPADATPEALVAMRERIRDAPATLADGLRPEANGRLRTQVDRTLDATWREVVVMRAGVVTVGLLLATLATTVMLLAARLIAERRAAENELLAARGASPADLRSVVVLEALALAVLTWLVAPWIARAAMVTLTGSGDLAAAGYVVDTGVPTAVLLACGVMAGVLAVALCVPAWHTAGSSSSTPHASLLRAGGDVALLVLGGLAIAQLVAYGSPVTHGADGLGVDGVLVAGPALVTLAAATVALRLVGPLGRLADLVAARARSFVAPFAAWQVSRRSSIATGTILVVVVAVASGTFSAAFLSTWRTSQVEQVDLALGTDLRVDGLDDRTQATRAVLTAAAGPDAHVQPVLDRSVGVGRGRVGGGTARLVALDTSRPQDLRGRSGMPAAALTAGLQDAPPLQGTPTDVPPGTQWLVLTGVLSTTPVTGGQGMVHLIVEDPGGLLVQLEPRTVQLDEEFKVALEVPPADGLRIVAVGASLAPLGDSVPELVVDLSATGLGAVPRSAGLGEVKALGAPASPMALSTSGWSGALRQQRQTAPLEVGGGTTSQPGAGDFRATGVLRSSGRPLAPATLLARAWEPPARVPAVLSRAFLSDIDVHSGALLTVELGGTDVDVVVERIVDQVPGAPRRPAVLVDHLTLARAVLEAGGQTVTPDAWWVASPGSSTATFTQALTGTDGVAHARLDLRADALTGPVRVAVPATLSLVTGAALLLVLVGVGAVAAAATRARRLELARLQALGASRQGLMGGMVVESAVLVLLGAAVGVLAGYALAGVVAPLLTMSPDGRAPVPDARLVWAWASQAGRTTAVVAGAVAVVSVVVALGVRRTSGAALRMGDDR